jgi:6-pyruvoyl-tetrahydropterin synthase
MQLFVNNLTNVDFSYLHPQRGLVGETWLASTELDGSLDEQGMVCDFGIVKKTLRNWLDLRLDHCLLVPSQSPHLSLLEDDDYIELRWRSDAGELHCRSPKQAITLIDCTEINATSVAQWSVQQLATLLPDTLEKLKLEFEPEALADVPFYHYSHCLKKHAGNCQRIAHGHRSRIEISIDGKACPELEQQWAARWQDIYLGSRADLTGEGEQLSFAYQSQQGAFQLSLPASRCEMLETDTTVELIAQYITQQIKSQRPNSTVQVRAFEGLGKGAVYSL